MSLSKTIWMFPSPAVAESFPTPEIQLKELWANLPNSFQDSDVGIYLSFIIDLYNLGGSKKLKALNNNICSLIKVKG